MGRILANIAAAAAASFVVWWFWLYKPGAARASVAGGLQIARILVKGGYDPQVLEVAANRPVRLVFRREETDPCSEKVVSERLGIAVDLPPYQEVAVDLNPLEPGEYPFSCQMGMMHGKLIAKPEN